MKCYEKRNFCLKTGTFLLYHQTSEEDDQKVILSLDNYKNSIWNGLLHFLLKVRIKTTFVESYYMNVIKY